jgi:hypothetical protein
VSFEGAKKSVTPSEDKYLPKKEEIPYKMAKLSCKKVPVFDAISFINFCLHYHSNASAFFFLFIVQ